MPVQTKIDAMLALRSDGRLLVGRDRIAILEAISQRGSIMEAAKVLGFSYKTAWDAVSAVNNLMPRPVVIAQAGGARGGGAAVTAEGLQLVKAFRRLEEKLARISSHIAEEGLDGRTDLLFWSVAMKTSARNVFHCAVTEVRRGSVNVEVTLRVSETQSIVAIVTNESAADLGIVPAREAIALVKASSVMLARPEGQPMLSSPNQLPGTVIDRIDGGGVSEIVLDIGGGKTLVSTMAQQGADKLDLKIGEAAVAYFSPSQAILAVD